MTDITINIKTGPDNNQPKVTTIADKTKSSVPKAEIPIAESVAKEPSTEKMKEE
jgi:hypothetical protein